MTDDIISGGRGLRITQLRDATGAPAREVYLRDLSREAIGFKAYEAALRVLDARGATLADASTASFRYLDPGRGSGTIELLGFREDERQIIVDVFRVRDRAAELGFADPAARWPDRVSLAMAPSPWRNPVLTAVLLAAATLGFAALSVAIAWGPLRMTEPAATVSLALLALLPAGLSLFGAVYHARRIPWWRRLRASFRQTGEKMPWELRTTQ